MGNLLFCYLDKPSLLKLSNEVENLELTPNSSFEVSCFTNQFGNPRGAFKWFKNDIYIPPSTELLITNINFFILHFSKLKKEDTGSYKCRIENDEGYEERSFQLSIVGKSMY